MIKYQQQGHPAIAGAPMLLAVAQPQYGCASVSTAPVVASHRHSRYCQHLAWIQAISSNGILSLPGIAQPRHDRSNYGFQPSSGPTPYCQQHAIKILSLLMQHCLESFVQSSSYQSLSTTSNSLTIPSAEVPTPCESSYGSYSMLSDPT